MALTGSVVALVVGAEGRGNILLWLDGEDDACCVRRASDELQLFVVFARRRPPVGL